MLIGRPDRLGLTLPLEASVELWGVLLWSRGGRPSSIWRHGCGTSLEELWKITQEEAFS